MFHHRYLPSPKSFTPTVRPRRLAKGRPLSEPLESRCLLSVAEWTGGGGDKEWSNPANWQGDTVPAAGEDVDFPQNYYPNGGGLQINVSSNTTVGNLNFVGSYDLTGASLILDGNVSVSGLGNVFGVTINNPILGHNVTASVSDHDGLDLVNPTDDGHGYGITQTTAELYANLEISGIRASYTGPTVVTADTLVVDCPLTSHVQVDPGGDLYGTGVVDGITTEGSPAKDEIFGVDASGLSSDGGLQLSAGAGFSAGFPSDDEDGTNTSPAASDFQGMTVSGGPIDLAGASLGVGNPPINIPPGTVLTLISNQTGQPVEGTFAGLLEGAIVDDEYRISYVGGTSGRDVTLTVRPPTVVTISTSPSSFHVGQRVRVTARVIPPFGGTPTGTVTFAGASQSTFGSAQLIDGVASVGWVATYSSGDQTYLIGKYGGDANFAPSSGVLDENTPTVTLTSSHVPVFQGEHVTLTATVAQANSAPGTLTGSAIFFDNGSQIGSLQTLKSGTATFTDTTLPVGSNLITATYTGTESVLAATTAFPLVAEVRPDRTGTTPAIVSATRSASTHSETISAAVIGADAGPGGSAGLRYYWTAVHLSAGAKPPIFNVDGTESAKNITARFTKDGGYILRCEVKNASGNAATTYIPVVVFQTATYLEIEPRDAQIPEDGTEQFTGSALDQFDHPMRTPQTFTYLVVSGPGSISSSGLFSASAIAGPVTVELEADDLRSTVGLVVE